MANKASPKKTTKKKACSKCEKEQALINFYNTSDIEFFPDSKLHVCKTCCLQIVDEKGFDGFQTLMRLINKPIYQDLYKNDAGDYIRMMNSMPQYKSVTFSDSDQFRENRSLELTKRIKPKELTEEELKESEDFFGLGFTEGDYIWLNNELQDYGAQYDISSKAMEDLIKEVCLTKLDIRNKRASGQDVKNELKSLQDLLGSSNLKPNQETGSQSIEQETFGTLIKKWEDTRPIQDESEWKNKDSIGKYLRVWFTGHLMRMFSVENKDEKEYYEELNKYTVEAEIVDDEEIEGEKDGRNN